MSVNAINGVDAQQQPQKHSALPSAIAGGVGLGAVGAAGGWFLGGKKPTLEELFTQRPDTFTKKEITEKDSEAAKKLEDAVNEYKNAGATEKTNLRTANRAVTSAVNGQTPDKQAKLQKAVDDAKNALSQKEVEIEGKKYKARDIAKDLNDARAEVKAAENGDDAAKTAAKTKLETAQSNAKKFNEEVKNEAKAVVDAKKKLAEAKKAKFDEAAKVADSAEKKLVDTATEAKNKLTEAKSSKLKEILDRKEIKEAFGKIEGAIKKEGKGKMAAIAGSIAAAVGLIGGYMMGGSHSDKA